jgi:hypothetical protein
VPIEILAAHWGSPRSLRISSIEVALAELTEQVKAMTEEEAAEVRLVYAPDWPSKATLIDEIRKRTGTTQMSREDFDRHFGSLPTDGAG